MHILVVNDDGPPSPHSSPYVHSLVRELQAAGHVVSVCLPHTQRSWIGKAHIIGQTVKPTYYRPPPASAPAAGLGSPGDDQGKQADQGTTHARPSTRPGTEEWVLVDGTPASCVQIGLHHFFAERGPVDLVVSGPNYGRNTTAVFALSSGTLGGALEAAVCRRRAVALSYAFFNRNHDADVIAAAGRRSVKVLEALAAQWPEDGSVDLYSVNVPLVEGLEEGKVLYTEMLQNYWEDGSCFTEVDGSVDGREEDEERIREDESRIEENAEEAADSHGHKHMHFKWSPRFSDVYKSVEEAPPGNDGWAVKEGHTSVTPLKANFYQSASHLHGKELKLQVSQDVSHGGPEAVKGAKSALQEVAYRSKPEVKTENHLWALIAYEDDYVQPLILAAMRSLLPSESWTLVKAPAPGSEVSLASLVPSPDFKILQITPYETIDFDYAQAHPGTCLINSYMIRKALIRKHFLSATVDIWVAKNPGSVLKTHVKRSEAFEVDYAEFLDDALIEAFDLRASLDQNALVPAKDREWWILKPSMSDRGQGIRLFSTMEELQDIFDTWEEDLPDSDDEEDEDEEGQGGASVAETTTRTPGKDDAEGDYITTSHLRHFVAQPYIDPPLLLPQLGNRKFHIRTYVVAVGSLRVYVYRHMLALFAAKTYQPPWAGGGQGEDGEEEEGEGGGGAIDLDAHLTNTCIQGPGAGPDAVARFWDLPLPATLGGGGVGGGSSPDSPSPSPHEAIFEQVCRVAGEAFEAAAREMMVHFQPQAGAFEVYGVDFLVDAAGTLWLLEVNAFPDFRQTGDDPRLRDVVAGFWAGALRLAVGPFAASGRGDGGGGGGGGAGGAGSEGEEGTREFVEPDDMVLVKDIDLGRR